MAAHLLSLTDGPSILIDKPILVFGRHEDCDIQLPSKKVSRRHCILAQVNDYLVVRDLGSTNGVRINGQRVVEGKLHPGDELTIGNFKYQICGDMLGRNTPPLSAEMREYQDEVEDRISESQIDD
jgi:pSer/pThr/pTyr-binding forkhead associated (FHA) protein